MCSLRPRDPPSWWERPLIQDGSHASGPSNLFFHIWSLAQLCLLYAVATAQRWPSPCLPLICGGGGELCPLGAPRNPGGDWSPAMELMPSLLGASGRLVLGSGNWIMGLQGRGGCESQEALVHRGARCRVAAPSWCSSGMTSTTVWP